MITTSISSHDAATLLHMRDVVARAAARALQSGESVQGMPGTVAGWVDKLETASITALALHETSMRALGIRAPLPGVAASGEVAKLQLLLSGAQVAMAHQEGTIMAAADEAAARPSDASQWAVQRELGTSSRLLAAMSQAIDATCRLRAATCVFGGREDAESAALASALAKRQAVLYVAPAGSDTKALATAISQVSSLPLQIEHVRPGTSCAAMFGHRHFEPSRTGQVTFEFQAGSVSKTLKEGGILVLHGVHMLGREACDVLKRVLAERKAPGEEGWVDLHPDAHIIMTYPRDAQMDERLSMHAMVRYLHT